jgi:hypothetical protein
MEENMRGIELGVYSYSVGVAVVALSKYYIINILRVTISNNI